MTMTIDEGRPSSRVGASADGAVALLNVPGTRLDVLQVGEGRDLVLFHSLLTDRRVFNRVITTLGDGRRLTLVNLPGFGASDPTGPAIEDYADRVALLFPALELKPESTDVVGVSFGGCVSIALAVRHGHLFSRLVLVDAAAAFPATAKARLHAMADQASQAGMGAVVDTALHQTFTARFITARPDIVAARSETLLGARPEYFADACRALADLDLRPVLAKIKNDTLVVVGKFDVMTPPALARELKEGIASARLVEIPRCGHCPPDEQPKTFAREVRNFLSGWTPWKATARDLFLNVAGFLLIFMVTGFLAAVVRTGLEKLLGLGLRWPALAFALIVGGGWAALFGVVRREHLRNPDGRVLPLPAAGFLLGAAVVWVYIFAGVSDVLMALGAVQYTAPGRQEDLLYNLTDSYMWHFLDLIPGLNITTAMGWKSPVDLQGGVRGALLVLFRVAVIYQVLAKGREIFKPDEPEVGG
jgi:pimeloyl-ACP methyl ester carboxylesterase